MTPPAEAERAAGIECYATVGAPCPARAKTAPEDFVVEEQIIPQGLAQEARPDYFPLYRVEKRSIDTMHMARDLSVAFRSRVSYGGLKDKRAVAVQYVTPTSLRADRPLKVVRESFTASLIGYLPNPLSRASLVGNGFVVVLRDCCDEVGARVEETISLANGRLLPNFYGLQRFGTSGSGTHLIGRELVKRQFEGAVRRMLTAADSSDREGSRMIEEAMGAQRYDEVARLLPSGKDVEKMVAKELGRHPGKWIKALRAVPVRLRRFYVQAYQSWIFNRTLSGAIRNGEDISGLKNGDNWAPATEGGLVTSAVRGVRETPAAGAMPMVQLMGYAYRDYGSRFDAVIKEVLEEEEITPGQFYVKEMQEVSSEGGFRRPHLAIRDASWSMADGTVTLRFVLGKGQYATIFLREIIKPRDPAASGLA